MKIENKIYIIQNFRVKILILLGVIFTLILFFHIFSNYHGDKFITEVSTINTKHIEHIENDKTNVIGEKEIEDLKEVINLKEYTNMPEKIGKYRVVGKIEISKIKIEKYILETTNEESLKKGVTKICGPKINRTGNFCIAGHNFQNTFGKLKQLEEGDIIKLTDTYDRTVEYKIYDIEKVSPSNTDCLSQKTEGDREITLVTCTLGAVKRIVVKAVEIYD